MITELRNIAMCMTYNLSQMLAAVKNLEKLAYNELHTGNELATRQLMHDEGFRQHPYKCPMGRLTIGYGLNLEDLGLERHQAEWLLRDSVSRIDRQLQEEYLWYKELNDIRKSVLINMTYNLGLGGLAKFTQMLWDLERGDYKGASNEMMDSLWAHQVKGRATKLARLMRDGKMPDE